MAKYHSLFIKGEWKEAHGKEFISINPAATFETLWQGAAAHLHDVELAVTAAREAFEEWGVLPLEKRIDYLKAYQQVLEEEASALAMTISQETGKPLWESKGEVTSMIAKIPYSIEAYHDRCRRLTRSSESLLQFCQHKPHGVVAVLGPFNFPGHLPNGHIVPALLAGNTVVFKPSEQTPLTGEKMTMLWQKAELPPGVFNLVQGFADIGKALSASPDIDGLFFTGSFAGGQALNRQFASTPGKILALEMGGNNPLIIGTLSDPHIAAYLTLQSAYLTSGQRCSCARRLIVVENEKSEQFLEILVQMLQRLHVSPFNTIPEPFMGPVISEPAYVRLISKQAEWQAKGGKILAEMELLQEKTFLLSPGLMDITAIKERTDEEIFGPLLALIRVPDFSSALQEANRTAYGLTAGLISEKKSEYEQFYQKIRAGIVNWNVPLTGASSGLPFGGIGNSGNHRPSAYYAADYCAYPVSSTEAETLKWPSTLTPGIEI